MQANALTAWWLTPESEKGQKKPTRFRLKPLSGEVALEVCENSEMTEQGIKPNATGRRIIWEHGLIGWEQFKKGKTNLKFQDFDFDERLELIPAPVLLEIANDVFQQSMMTVEQRKNSSSQ